MYLQVAPWFTARPIGVLTSHRYEKGKLKCVILGHSFVSRLFFQLRDQLEDTVGTSGMANLAAKYFKVDDYIGKIFVYGKGGARKGKFNIPWHMLKKINPDLVFIDIGSNDLVCLNKEISSIAQWVLDLAIKIKFTYDAKVYICSVVPRAAGLRGISTDLFLDRMSQYNQLMAHLVAHSFVGIDMHRHKGFYKVQEGNLRDDLPVGVWSEDGIHPDTEIGREKYRCSLRSPMLTFARNNRM